MYEEELSVVELIAFCVCVSITFSYNIFSITYWKFFENGYTISKENNKNKTN